ncbi:SGNH/GDSL hydrolase family protein [Mucilaginibacter gotjawali]|uniref:Lysophospholipase L1-like esterase n=2 Tax=Mucilaginibacter gotjawali TaxID=1550579 RepID=A0A839SQ96_9SPHI|nr:SGNH/GDSL hydrolase family protein [Mucilaginibacter gotjawali]MBB3058537.1 lysophospholipase L1-like esterase [Mucilaginibacter gotjawali]BAU55761.1 GDSL-like Lipase/Acylhydrolase [Mucilaginibacter gotjawali]
MENNTKRRQFIKQAGLAAIATMVTAEGFPADLTKPQNNGKTVTVLFQGDSITDGGRSFNQDWNHVLGQGYAYLVSSMLWYQYIGHNMMFYNRGISGNTVLDLQARWQQDTIDIKPDILSIMVGVNDVYGVIHNKNPRTAEQFRADLQALLKQTKQALPETKIVICEPFILPLGQVADAPERWQNEIAPRQAIVKELAAQFDTAFIPLQRLFLSACNKAPADYWIWDGIHPMPAGHQLIADEWIKTVKKEFKFPV